MPPESFGCVSHSDGEAGWAQCSERTCRKTDLRPNPPRGLHLGAALTEQHWHPDKEMCVMTTYWTEGILQANDSVAC